MNNTGIILFVYDRPNHTQQVIEGLRENGIDHLYIFADGAASPKDEANVQAVRNIVQSINWCDAELITRDQNWGIKQSVVKGYEYVLDRHERVVALEDDSVPAPDFVDFMDRILNSYADNDQIMNVHGYSPPIDIPDDYPYDIFFTHRTGSWGQGVWRDSWNNYKEDPMEFKQLAETVEGRKKLNRAGDGIVEMIKKEIDGEINSVGAWWTFTVIKHGGLSVNPIQSRVKNIGHDGTGTHCGSTSRFDIELPDNPKADLDLPKEPFVDKRINQRYNRYFEGKSKAAKLKQIVKDGLIQFISR